jgi:N-methylhydantoinase A
MKMVGVDVGGTFTDIFVLDEATGRAEVAKVPTTRPDQSGGFLAGIRGRVPDLSHLSVVVHGTTAGTNALLERKGAKAGVITTRGFARRPRDAPPRPAPDVGLRGDFEPVVPRDLRLEVPERTLADGTVRTEVDLDAVRDAARQLLAEGCEAVAILFANAYANPANETAAAEVVRALWPNPHVTASHEILPEIREFERFSTAALNAYLQPEVAGYLDRLETALKGGGFGGEFLIVQSNGGVMGVETACRRPVRTALSGPAAGVIAAAHIATSAGFDNVVTGDMGGTSFDVALIADGRRCSPPQTSIDFGLVMRQPMIEITTIGAGGGSIAWVDARGLLNIGPKARGPIPAPSPTGAATTGPRSRTPTSCSVASTRTAPSAAGAARRGGRARRHRRARGQTPGAVGRGGGGGDPRGRQFAHGRRDPARLDRARLRPQALRLPALRRRRRAACLRADGRRGPRARHRAALSGRDLGHGLRDRRHAAGLRADGEHHRRR